MRFSRPLVPFCWHMKKKITLSLGKIFVSDTARQLLLLHLRVAAASRVSTKKRIHSCLFTWGLTGSISHWFCFILLKQSVMHIYQFHFNQKPASPFSSFTYYALSLPFPSSRNTWKILTKMVSISSSRSIKLSKFQCILYVIASRIHSSTTFFRC